MNIWYMDDWKKFNETSLLEKKKRFLQSLKYGRYYWCRLCACKKSFYRFWNKKIGRISWFVCSKPHIIVSNFITLKICTLKYEKLDPAKFLSAPGLAWQANLKNTKVKLDLLIDIDMLLMIEKGIRGGKYHSIYWYVKPNNIYMKNYDKNKESSYIQYCDVNNLYGWAMMQKLPANSFEWIKGTSQFNEDFIKNAMKKVMKDIF